MTRAGALVPESDHVMAQWSPFAMMDALDDEAILRELEGIATETLVYIIKDKKTGEQIVGLSKGGVDEAANILAHQGEVIREETLTYSVQEGSATRAPEALFTCLAARYAVSKDGREIKLDQVFGVKRQPLYFEGRDGGAPRANPFWYEQGAMKAARNARARLVPANVKAEIIARAKQTKRQRVVEAPAPGDRPAAGQPGAPAAVPAGPAKAGRKADFTPQSFRGKPLAEYTSDELVKLREWALRKDPQKLELQIAAIEDILAGRAGD